MPDVTPELNNLQIRKWAVQRFCVADYGTPVPAALFGADHRPIALPPGFFDLGGISTDGITSTDSLSGEATKIDQQLEDARYDLTDRSKSLAATFMERNAWVKALRAGLLPSQFPADKYGPTDFTEGQAGISDFPELTALLYRQDRVGTAAVYGVEALFRIKIDTLTDRTRSRAGVDSTGVTFKVLPDARGTNREVEDGPGLGAASTLPTVVAITPPGLEPGDLVTVSGTHLATATGVTFDGQVAEFEPTGSGSLVAIIPAGVTGEVPVVVTTPTGSSIAVPYTAA